MAAAQRWMRAKATGDTSKSVIATIMITRMTIAVRLRLAVKSSSSSYTPFSSWFLGGSKQRSKVSSMHRRRRRCRRRRRRRCRYRRIHVNRYTGTQILTQTQKIKRKHRHRHARAHVHQRTEKPYQSARAHGRWGCYYGTWHTGIKGMGWHRQSHHAMEPSIKSSSRDTTKRLNCRVMMPLRHYITKPRYETKIPGTHTSQPARSAR